MASKYFIYILHHTVRGIINTLVAFTQRIWVIKLLLHACAVRLLWVLCRKFELCNSSASTSNQKCINHLSYLHCNLKCSWHWSDFKKVSPWHWLKASALCVWVSYCLKVVVRSLAGQSNPRSVDVMMWRYRCCSITVMMAVKWLPAALRKTQPRVVLFESMKETSAKTVNELQDACHASFTHPLQMIRRSGSIYFQLMSVNKCSWVSLLTSQDTVGCCLTFPACILCFDVAKTSCDCLILSRRRQGDSGRCVWCCRATREPDIPGGTSLSIRGGCVLCALEDLYTLAVLQWARNYKTYRWSSQPVLPPNALNLLSPNKTVIGWYF